jgi:predicted GIY-YIG superfamily endonuclease
VNNLSGIIYMLHFSKPYAHARHYIGWTTDLALRLHDHRLGRGARLIAVIRAAGIDFQLARTTLGTRTDERAIKHAGGATR